MFSLIGTEYMVEDLFHFVYWVLLNTWCVILRIVLSITFFFLSGISSGLIIMPFNSIKSLSVPLFLKHKLIMEWLLQHMRTDTHPHTFMFIFLFIYLKQMLVSWKLVSWPLWLRDLGQSSLPENRRLKVLQVCPWDAYS